MTILTTWLLLGTVGLILMYIHRSVEDGQGIVYVYKNHGLLAMWRGFIFAHVLGPITIILYLYLQYLKYVKKIKR